VLGIHNILLYIALAERLARIWKRMRGQRCELCGRRMMLVLKEKDAKHYQCPHCVTFRVVKK